jgi:hypothetical protein
VIFLTLEIAAKPVYTGFCFLKSISFVTGSLRCQAFIGDEYRSIIISMYFVSCALESPRDLAGSAV